jgi:hypothetical protein
LISKVLVKVLEIYRLAVSIFGSNRSEGYFKLRVEPLVGEEGSDLCSRMGSVVVSKFGEGEQVDPVVLLIIDVYSEILFQYLVDPFGLTIGLGVIGCGEVAFDPEEFAE